MRREVLQTFCVLGTIVPEAILEAMLIPLYPFMVRSMMKDSVTDIGYYVGLLGSAFYFPLLFMNLVWGGVSDRYGRKPVLIIGLVVCGICTFTIGTTSSFWVAWMCRFMAGFFGGSSTVAKGMLGEIFTNETDRAWGYAMYGTVYGVAGIVGPLIGGYLLDPNDPHPIHYPCMLGVGMVLVSILGWTQIPSGAPTRKPVPSEPEPEPEPEPESSKASDEFEPQNRKSSSSSTREPSILKMSAVEPRDGKVFVAQSPSPYMSLLTPRLLFPISIYCIIAFGNMSYATALSLFFSASPKTGGLGLSPKLAASFMSILPAAKLVVQFFLFSRLHRIVGVYRTYQIGMIGMMTLLLVVGLPSLSSLVSFPTLSVIMACLGTGEALAYLSVFMLITEGAKGSNLGLAHGFASTCAAGLRTISPALTGYLWELGIHTRLYGLIFLLLSLLGLLGVYMCQNGPAWVAHYEGSTRTDPRSESESLLSE
ncbi:major facilitator superfamily domain-containing protein [Polychytrium aggregatum]|uniref:major facilitator superfamily domain-containing protein n=1 Tax=Polychytrium aggregatum TaxID=110093 RepID=UPI0022FDC4E9|nr:major facilitator superfamily domain-containing protein [Polychytrium aggregatum]KAI9208447.1 major facilitator superfamily domain-containing protein [Polychytrium aggregatum]